MACPRHLFRVPFEIFLQGTNDMFIPLGREFNITGATAVDFAVTVSRVTGTARVVGAVALITARPEEMDAPAQAAGGYTSTQTTTHNTFDLSTVTNKYLAQAGIIGNLSSAGSPAYASGYVDVTVSQCMAMVGQRKIEVTPQLDTTNPTYFVIGRVPANSANEVRAAVIAEGIQNVDYRFVVRGVNDPDAPGAWQALGAGYTTLGAGNSGTCYPDTALSGAITPANFHQLEFGLALKKTATGTAEGQIRVALTQSYT